MELQQFPGRKIDAILFDLDGVLVDTEGTYTDFWAETGDVYGLGGRDFALAIKGNTLENILAKHFRPEEHEAVRRRCRAFEDTMQFPFFPATLPLLRRMKKEGVKTAIVTSSGPRKMEILYSQCPELHELVDVLIKDDDVTRSKPDPQGYLLAAERLGVEPANCIVMEDSLAGIEAGHRAGCLVVGIATTVDLAKTPNSADVVADSLDTASNYLV